MQLGLYTFADMQPDKTSGKAVNAHRRIQQLMEEIQLADKVGLDVFAVGEHHRPGLRIRCKPFPGVGLDERESSIGGVFCRGLGDDRRIDVQANRL